VKVRGRGKQAAPQPKVPKSRVKPQKPTPPPPVVTPDRVPAPAPGPPDDKGPPADKHRVEPPGQAKKGVGKDDGTLERVPGGPKP
jgi:hypothetical protein